MKTRKILAAVIAIGLVVLGSSLTSLALIPFARPNW